MAVQYRRSAKTDANRARAGGAEPRTLGARRHAPACHAALRCARARARARASASSSASRVAAAAAAVLIVVVVVVVAVVRGRGGGLGGVLGGGEVLLRVPQVGGRALSGSDAAR